MSATNEHVCCWHEYQLAREAVGVGLYHCCRPGCLDLLVARAGAAVEEKTHGYLKGHRPRVRPAEGMEPPRLRVIGSVPPAGDWVQTSDGMQLDLSAEGRCYLGDGATGPLAEALAAQVARMPEGHDVRIVAKVYSRAAGEPPAA